MPKTARGHQQSSAAALFPPLDIQSKEDIAKAIQQIMKGPVTILLVYADWCGHCHEMMPHWDAASKSPDRTVPSIKLNEKATEAFNEALSHLNHNESSINVSAYPTVLVLDNKGKKITDVEAKKDTASLTQLMNRSGPLAEKAGLSQKPQAPSQAPSQAQEEEQDGLAAQGAVQQDMTASLEPLSLPLASPPRPTATIKGGAQYRTGGLYRALHPRTHKHRR